MTIRGTLFLGGALACLGGAQIAAAQGGADAASSEDVISEIVVTAQKRSENLQDVPIAVSAFSQEAMQAAGVMGANDLRTQVPNLGLSRTAVNGTNFSIRGIGAKLVAPSGDGGVGVHVNNAPLGTSRFADADFYDVERVEILRGPQGTLYGRNATGGVLNTITVKPTDDLSASATGEIGNYGTIRLKGFVNVPLGDMFAVRAAGFFLNREGFSKNELTGRDADDRDIFSTRLTLAFNPSDSLRAFLMWEHFHENDRRTRSSKAVCLPDPGPTSVGGVPVNNALARGLMSQGCLPGSIYSAAALGAPNTLATLDGAAGIQTGMLPFNANAGVMQNPNLRRFSSTVDPTYFAKNDLGQFNVELDVTDGLTLSALSSYSRDDFDVLSATYSNVPSGGFLTTPLSPGGVFNDPQFGAITAPASYQRSLRTTKQFSQELRLQSDFDGPINFSIGGIYLDLEAKQNFVLVSSSFTARSIFLNQTTNAGIYVDPLRDTDLTGHNYFISREDYNLKSKALFGEVYWEPTDTLKVTGGLRYTDDSKTNETYANPLFAPGRGLTAAGIQRVSFKELTGRANIAWTPDISFTDHSMVYASYSKGYKGGGFNPATAGLVSATFLPEFVNAFEIGTKNTLAGGKVILNATAFYYDYDDYQVARLVNISVANENIDAEIKGIELETIIKPVHGLRLNASLGLLDTKIKSSTSIDETNLTQGDPALTLVKAPTGGNCVVNTSAFAPIIGGINAGAIPAAALLGTCMGAFAGRGVVVSPGKLANLSGNQLPDAPKWTLTLGGQYDFDLSATWMLSVRADYYRQGKSYSRIYNTEMDKLKGYQNLNLSLTLSNEGQGFSVQGFVRNATNETVVVSSIPASSIGGLLSPLYLNDPRTYGVALTKSF